MVHNQFAVYKRHELADADSVKSVLTIKNPEHVQWQRYGNIFTEEPKEFLEYFSVKGDALEIPRNFHMYHPEYFAPGNFIDTQLAPRKMIEAEFTGVPRPYQQKFIDLVDFKNYTDILAVQPCGHGKTFFGVYVTCYRKVTTLVLVPGNDIALQWETAYHNFSTVTCTVATPNNFSKLLKQLPDVLIMTFDLFYARQHEFTNCAEVKTHFGMVILDEAHRVGAPTYMPVLSLLPVKYRLALTATFRRQDGMDKILQYHFGKQYIMANQFPKATVYPFFTNISAGILYDLDAVRGGKQNHEKNKALLLKMLAELGVEHRFKMRSFIELDLTVAAVQLPNLVFDKRLQRVRFYWKEKDPATERLVEHGRDIDMTADEVIIYKKIIQDIREYCDTQALNMMDTYMGWHGGRNRLFLHIVSTCIAAERKVLLIGKRKDPLKYLHELSLKLGFKSALLLGTTATEANLDYIRKEAQITWGIYQKTKEALDVEDFDTLILHQPIRDIEQPIGRTTRDKAGKKRAITLYPYDDYNPYRFTFYGAQKMNKKIADFMPPTTIDHLITRLY